MLWHMTLRGCAAGVRRRVLLQNRKFYERFPEDAEAVRRIVRHLALQPDGGVPTPAGNLLTPRALQSLGLSGVDAAALAELMSAGWLLLLVGAPMLRGNSQCDVQDRHAPLLAQALHGRHCACSFGGSACRQ
jgi:hypothetical protein